MSSWLCPEDKKDNWHPLSFFKAIWKAKCLRRQLFLHSLLQLSAWTCSIICRKSTLRSMDKVVRAELKISADLELLVEIQCCVKTVNAICPCTSTEVHAILGPCPVAKLFRQHGFAFRPAVFRHVHGIKYSANLLRAWVDWIQSTLGPVVPIHSAICKLPC